MNTYPVATHRLADVALVIRPCCPLKCFSFLDDGGHLSRRDGGADLDCINHLLVLGSAWQQGWTRQFANLEEAHFWVHSLPPWTETRWAIVEHLGSPADLVNCRTGEIVSPDDTEAMILNQQIQCRMKHVARQIAFGEFDGCDALTRERLMIGLQQLPEPLRRQSTDRLSRSSAKPNT
jgi:hypothetical protein